MDAGENPAVIRAVIAIGNRPSLRVAEKVGAVREGVGPICCEFATPGFFSLSA